ncbi:MAG: hypothetical protein D4R64_09020 [Porphyromonadaceae bacterium]|nr:MAG: hypothetical protein D4R64_09020 [Porphyromonadaceae bacterium]
MKRYLSLKIGWMATVLISALLICIYFTPVVKSLNTTVFSTGGDGLKSYYCYLYHIKDDHTALRFDGMNYPYGETIIYTDNQPFLSETMRFLCKVFPGLYHYSIAVWNGSLLLSIILAALFIYLILVKLGLPVAMSLAAGIGISMLSPQIMRMGAHFSLSYVFVIPMALYLLLKFSKKPSYKYSIAMFFLIIWSGATHMYYIAFLGMLIFLFWMFFGIGRPEVYGKWKTWLPHVIIQLILPVILVQLLVYISTDAFDRAKYPFGFLFYRAYPESVFLPADRHYGSFLQHIIHYNHVNWEGYAYIGMVATLACALFFGRVIGRLFKGRFRTGLLYDNDLFLTFLFWGSFLILLYSFGIPFILWMKDLVDYIGPLRQIRGLGRFAWVFYYAMNILAVYSVWRFFQSKKRKVIPGILLTVTLLILLAEAHVNFKMIFPYINKKNPEFIDFENTLPANAWVKNIDPTKYQSILPLPFFHIGSENIWLEPTCGMVEESFKVSLKTGLPLHAVMMGRTSLSQTYKSLELVWEPYRIPAILDELPSSKPILVLSAACDQLGPGERLILQHSQPVANPGNFKLSEISTDTLLSLTREHILALHESKDSAAVFDGKEFLMPDTTVAYTYLNFSENNADTGYLGSGTLVLPYKAPGKIFLDKINGISLPANVTFSFWVKNIKDDNMPRLTLETVNYNSEGKAAGYNVSILGRYLKQIDGPWGLIEFTIPVAAGESVSLTLFPGKVKKDIIIDDFLIRKAGTDVYGTEADKGWILNNRFYPAGMLK